MSELKNFEKVEAATFENLEIGFSAATLSYFSLARMVYSATTIIGTWTN